jgi:hypothetical protein
VAEYGRSRGGRLWKISWCQSLEDLVVVERGRSLGGRAWKISWWQSVEVLAVAEQERPCTAEHGGEKKTSYSMEDIQGKSMEDLVVAEHGRHFVGRSWKILPRENYEDIVLADHGKLPREKHGRPRVGRSFKTT